MFSSIYSIFFWLHYCTARLTLGGSWVMKIFWPIQAETVEQKQNSFNPESQNQPQRLIQAENMTWFSFMAI